jgi:DNA-directed RNA polymerase subunit omega
MAGIRLKEPEWTHPILGLALIRELRTSFWRYAFLPKLENRSALGRRTAGTFLREATWGAIYVVFGSVGLYNDKLAEKNSGENNQSFAKMRDDYLHAALKVINDSNILVNVASRRVKRLRRGNRALVESLEKLSAEDTALREILEGKISYELATPEELARR